MIDHWNLMAFAALLFGAAALAFVAATRGLEAGSHIYGFGAAVAAGGMALAYGLMTGVELGSVQFADADTIRFIGYTVMWIPIIYVTAAVAGVGHGLFAVLLGIVMGRVWITLLSWHLEGVLATITGLIPTFLLFAGIYVLYVPFTRVARTRSGERTLLFTKLKHLIVLAWLGLVVTAFLFGNGLVDLFIRDTTWFYAEAILVIGFGGLLLGNSEALERTATAGEALSTATGTDGSTAVSEDVAAD